MIHRWCPFTLSYLDKRASATAYPTALEAADRISWVIGLREKLKVFWNCRPCNFQTEVFGYLDFFILCKLIKKHDARIEAGHVDNIDELEDNALSPDVPSEHVTPLACIQPLKATLSSSEGCHQSMGIKLDPAEKQFDNPGLMKYIQMPRKPRKG